MDNKKFLNSSKKMIHSVGNLANNTKQTLEKQTQNILNKYDNALERVVHKVVLAFNKLVPDEQLEINKKAINRNNSIEANAHLDTNKNKPN